MKSVNRVVTLLLAVLALLLWAQGWWNAARLTFFGGVWQSTSEWSHIAYPRAMATVLTGCACLGWVLMNLSESLSWGEPRCRKCRYILHGVSEPRCPECGTPI